MPAVRQFHGVQRGDPSAQRFTDQAHFLHLQLPQKLIQKIHIRLDGVVQQRLVRFSESDLIRDQQPVFLSQRLQHRQPIFLTAPQPVYQHHYRPSAQIEIVDRLSKHGDGFVRRLPERLAVCRGHPYQEGKDRQQHDEPGRELSSHVPPRHFRALFSTHAARILLFGA